MQSEGHKPAGYLPRVVDRQVEEYLDTFGAVEIAGTKWCGKTWTALEHAASVSYVDLDLSLAQDDPSLMLLGERPHVIDEWQLVPSIWDHVRHEVDGIRGLRGAWILTGSSSPRNRGDGGNAPSHSGVGRIGRVRMSPMSLAESGESTGSVSLAALFEGRFDQCKAPVDTMGLVEAACRGGWPEAVGMDSVRAQRIAREYLRLSLDEGVPAQGRSGDVARRLVRSIARNLGQSTTYRTIIEDMYGAEEDPGSHVSAETVASYIDLLKRLYLVEELRGWEPPSRSKRRLVTRPKRYFADPSLAVAALGLSVESLLGDWQTFGLVFESLCLRDLAVYARALEMSSNEPLRYYRDDSGLEADAVIELVDGRWAAFEVKVSDERVPEGVSSLKRLRKKVVSDSPTARVHPPEFMAVITGTSGYAREVEEGIYAIPIRVLGT